MPLIGFHAIIAHHLLSDLAGNDEEAANADIFCMGFGQCGTNADYV